MSSGERPAAGILLGAVAGGTGADAVELGMWVLAKHLGLCAGRRPARERCGRQRGVGPGCWIASGEQQFISNTGTALLSGLPSRWPRPERNAAVLRWPAALRSGRCALEAFGAA